ncbi:MAG: NERD domain-containing protein [Erysipelotrichaceae bacterium]|nr:NERD domain-containing protein [Erysipelotrichaceae bacterium]
MLKRKALLHKLKIGIRRVLQSNNDHVNSMKLYGNHGELSFYTELYKSLPASAEIKRNIIVRSENRDAEIDLLVIYNEKLFAIELKRWKGMITNHGDVFYQGKVNERGSGLIHRKKVRSPFKQLARSIYLLKESTIREVYINPIVYFLDNDDVHVHADSPWFNDIDRLVRHIKNEGRRSRHEDIETFVGWLTIGDKTYGRNDKHEVTGIINSYSLQFETADRVIKKTDIDYIMVNHHFSYDDLDIHLRNGEAVTVQKDNGSMIMEHDRVHDTFYYSKIDLIVIGR